MELELVRTTRTAKTTIGDLAINGKFECHILEDKDRGLRQGMTLSELMALKIKTKTAIPAGRYEIAVNFSNKFNRKLPLLLNVPAFEGIRIHVGNFEENTDGCLLPGKDKAKDMVISSRAAFDQLFAKIEIALNREKVFITIS